MENSKRLDGIGNIIDKKMELLVNGKYKNEILLDNEYRFTPLFFQMMAEIFLDIVNSSREKGVESK